MFIKINNFTKNNLKNSIFFSLNYVLNKGSNLDAYIVFEITLQIFKDVYLYLKNEHLKQSVSDVPELIGLEITQEEKIFLKKLEENFRTKDNTMKFISSTSINLCNNILKKLNNYLIYKSNS